MSAPSVTHPEPHSGNWKIHPMSSGSEEEPLGRQVPVAGRKMGGIQAQDSQFNLAKVYESAFSQGISNAQNGKVDLVGSAHETFFWNLRNNLI